MSQLSGNAASIGPGTWNHLVPLFGQALLSDFFKVCEHPNEAELHMFTAIFNFPDVEHTEHCCKLLISHASEELLTSA